MLSTEVLLLEPLQIPISADIQISGFGPPKAHITAHSLCRPQNYCPHVAGEGLILGECLA